MSLNENLNLPSLKLTAIAPENRPKPNRKQSYSNHPFLGVMLVSGRVSFFRRLIFSIVDAGPRKTPAKKDFLVNHRKLQ